MSRRVPVPGRRVEEFGPFTWNRGMRDSTDASRVEEDTAFVLENLHPVDPTRPGGIRSRPGTVNAGATSVGTKVQGITQFTKLDGTELTVAIVDGEIYTYDWTLDSWTKVIDTADLTGDSITLSATVRVYTVVFADKLIVSDGVNTPFNWDGTTGAGLEDMTNAPVFFGQPDVYYAKLFGIKNDERSTIVWSEENQTNAGYSGLNNVWTLGQTDQDQLFRLIGTNEALYYFRARSIGIITGAVGPEFKSTGTHEAVTSVNGTTSPGSTTWADGQIYFLDAEGNPHIITREGVIRPISGTRNTVRTWKNLGIPNAQVYSNHESGQISFVSVNTGDIHFSVNVDIEDDIFVGTTTGLGKSEVGEVKDLDGFSRIMFGDSNGWILLLGTEDDGPWTDQVSTDGSTLVESPIVHVLETQAVGYDAALSKQFHRVDPTFRVADNLTAVQLQLISERGEGRQATFDVVSGVFVLDISELDVGMFGGGDIDQRVAIRTFGRSRWARYRFTHNSLGEQFGMFAMQVQAIPEVREVTAV